MSCNKNEKMLHQSGDKINAEDDDEKMVSAKRTDRQENETMLEWGQCKPLMPTWAHFLHNFFCKWLKFIEFHNLICFIFSFFFERGGMGVGEAYH